MTHFLASVTNRAEMELAQRAGADIVDLKQPSAGALGAWTLGALRAGVALWRDWPEPKPDLSATIGDQPMVAAILREAAVRIARTGVPIVKIGLLPSEHVENCIDGLAALAGRTRLVGVLFADRRPDFALIGRLGRAGFAGVMLDTADKKAGGLRHHLDELTLGQFVVEARRHGLMTGLAGSLGIDDIAPLAGIGADYLGFRGALCVEGRTSRLDPERLRMVRSALGGPAAPAPLRRPV